MVVVANGNVARQSFVVFFVVLSTHFSHIIYSTSQIRIEFFLKNLFSSIMDWEIFFQTSKVLGLVSTVSLMVAVRFNLFMIPSS